MAQKYLSEFFSYRNYNLATNGGGLEIDGADTSLERRLQRLVLRGNRAFHHRKYQRALEHYLQAWSLLPRTLVPSFPSVTAALKPTELLSLDLSESLTAAAAEIIRLRDADKPQVPIVAPIEPPAALIQLMGDLGVAFDPLTNQAAVLNASIERGELEVARIRVKDLIAANPRDERLVANLMVVDGVLAHHNGEFDRAKAVLNESAVKFDRLGDVSSGELVRENRMRLERSIDRSRPLPGNTGEFVVPNTDVVISLPGAAAPSPAKSASVMVNGALLDIDVSNADAIENVLANRPNAQSLLELHTGYEVLTQFVSYLAHVGAFIIPLAIADTYHELGDHERAVAFYRKVRDYRYLNRTIERTAVWRKMARTYVAWGNLRYRERDLDGAREKFEEVLRISGDTYVLDGDLYKGAFADLQAETLQFLHSDNRRGFDGMDYGRRIVLLEAESSLRAILGGINYLGYSEDLIPIHTWRYLQNVARYLTNQARQAERAYISFKDQAERDEFTRLTLKQSVDSQRAALDVEDRRVAASSAQRDVARRSRDLAQTRRDNAQARRDEYAAISATLAKLEEINGWATGPMDKAEINENYGDVLGISPGTYDTYQITRIVARRRAELNRAQELANLDRFIDEQDHAVAVADGQVDVADRMFEVALASRELAELRADQAEAQLEFFDAQELGPELWGNLADAQRDLSQRYLDWAIGGAFLMERAFEVEYDLDLNRIRFDYSRSELNGLLAADFLLADIDEFAFDRIFQTEKQLPAKVSLSLSSRYPLQFQRDFKTTGRMDFQTFLSDFDRWVPGEHLRKIKRVELVVEGLIGGDGIHGTLTATGTSRYRDRAGIEQLRIQNPETMVLSRYDLRHDGFVFGTDEGLLHVFENMSVASGWILDLPPESNDLNYDDITDVHLVIYYDAYYSEAVATAVRNEMALTPANHAAASFGLRYQYPDEFFGFADGGSLSVDISRHFLPYNEEQQTIEDLMLVVETEEGVSAEGLTVHLARDGGAPIVAVTDANGVIATGPGSLPLNALRTNLVLGTWHIAIPEAENATAVAAGFSHDKVSNLFIAVDYAFVPRTSL
ncbi:MAG: hypothetical protein AAF515_11570 [Pseudomonadota bacterium]